MRIYIYYYIIGIVLRLTKVIIASTNTAARGYTGPTWWGVVTIKTVTR